MYEVKAYHCSYCKKYGMYKSNIKKHEATCFRNPETRSCATCANYTQKEENNYHSQFPFDCTPICLDGISLEEPQSFMDDTPKVKLHTLCAKWIERPEDEEELAIYQADKKVIEIFPTDDEILWP